MGSNLPEGVYRDGDGFYAVARVRLADGDWTSYRVRKVSKPELAAFARGLALVFWDSTEGCAPPKRDRMFRLFLKGLTKRQVFIGDTTYVSTPRVGTAQESAYLYGLAVRAAFEAGGGMLAKKNAVDKVVASHKGKTQAVTVEFEKPRKPKRVEEEDTEDET